MNRPPNPAQGPGRPPPPPGEEDWCCPKLRCGRSNFHYRNDCYVCHAARPGSGSASDPRGVQVQRPDTFRPRVEQQRPRHKHNEPEPQPQPDSADPSKSWDYPLTHSYMKLGPVSRNPEAYLARLRVGTSEEASRTDCAAHAVKSVQCLCVLGTTALVCSHCETFFCTESCMQFRNVNPVGVNREQNRSAKTPAVPPHRHSSSQQPSHRRHQPQDQPNHHHETGNNHHAQAQPTNIDNQVHQQPQVPSPRRPGFVSGCGRGRLFVVQPDSPAHSSQDEQRPQKLQVPDNSPLLLNQEIEVTTSWIETPLEFYVVQVNDLAELDKIETEVGSLRSWATLEDCAVGDDCVCYYLAKDPTVSGWYRATILQLIEPALVKVRFIDYGNTSIVSTNNLKALPVSLARNPPLARRAELLGEKNSDWNPAAVAQFKNMVEKKCCRFTPLEYDAGIGAYKGRLATEDSVDISQALSLCFPNTIASEPEPEDDQTTGTEATSSELQSSRIDDATAAKSKSSYQFTSDKLTVLTLPEDTSKKVFIIAHTFSFDEFYVLPADARQTYGLELQDEINEWMELSEESLQLAHSPLVGQVFITVEYTELGERYFRGVVERAMLDGYYEVRNVDSGKLVVAYLSDIKLVSRAIFEIPTIGLRVKLDGVETKPNLILQDDFDFLLRRFHKSRTLFKLVVVDNSGSSPTVVLTQNDDSSNLAKRINGLRKWEWEALYESGARTDDEIMEKQTNDGGNSVPVLINPSLPIGTDIQVDIVSIDYQKGRLPYIVFQPVLPYMLNLTKAFQNQVAKYMKEVGPSKFYPGYQSMVFLSRATLTPHEREGDGHSAAERSWHRCIRIDSAAERFHCIDTNEQFVTDSDGEYMFRKVVPDFQRIPTLLCTGTLSDSSCDKFMLTCFAKAFSVGRRMTIKLLPGTKDGVFVYECGEFATTISQVFQTYKSDSDSDR